VKSMIESTRKGSAMLPFRTLPLFFILVCGAAGCSDVMSSDDALQQDVAQLRRDVNTLMVNASRRPPAETTRPREQTTDTTQLAALSARLDNLSAELGRLSTRLDDLSQRLDASGRPGPRTGAIQRPPSSSSPPPPPARSVPGGPSTGEASRTGPSSGEVVRSAPGSGEASRSAATEPPPRSSGSAENDRGSASVAAAPSGAELSAQDSYQAAYQDFSKGRYALAIPEFREFIRRFPDSPLSDSAQYSIGESYFSLARASATAGQADRSRQEMEQAVREFRRVLVNYPRGSKVPAALYKEALALTELKQTALAQARLQYLLDHFPQSEEAPLAKEQLAALKQ